MIFFTVCLNSLTGPVQKEQTGSGGGKRRGATKAEVVRPRLSGVSHSNVVGDRPALAMTYYELPPAG
jgi:hypothetical protein